MTVLAVWCLLAAAAFVVRLGQRDWRRTAAARSAMILGAVVTLTLSLSVIRRVLGMVPNYLWIVIFVLIAVALTYQLYALEKTQREGDRRERRRLEREQLRG